MILTCAEMKALEARAFADGVSPEALMDEAGAEIAAGVRQFCPGAGKCVVFFGKGHNGGDALVAARHLASSHWEIELRAVFPEEAWSDLTRKQHRRFQDAAEKFGETIGPPACPPVTIVLDGLLGIGSGGALREPIRAAAKEINRLRKQDGALVFALDLPTGLDCDSGEPLGHTVRATHTATFVAPKRGFLAPGAAAWVGEVHVIDIGAPRALVESYAAPAT